MVKFNCSTLGELLNDSISKTLIEKIKNVCAFSSLFIDSLSLQFPIPASKVFFSNFLLKSLLKFGSHPSLPPRPLRPPPSSLRSTTPNYGLWLAAPASHRELPLKGKQMTSLIKKEPRAPPLRFKHHLLLQGNPQSRWLLPQSRSSLHPLWAEGVGLRKRGGAIRSKHLTWIWRLKVYWANSPLRNSKAKR